MNKNNEYWHIWISWCSYAFDDRLRMVDSQFVIKSMSSMKFIFAYVTNVHLYTWLSITLETRQEHSMATIWVPTSFGRYLTEGYNFFNGDALGSSVLRIQNNHNQL